MFETDSGALLDILRDRAIIDDAQAVELKEEQARGGKPIAQVLQDFGIISYDDLRFCTPCRIGKGHHIYLADYGVGSCVDGGSGYSSGCPFLLRKTCSRRHDQS